MSIEVNSSRDEKFIMMTTAPVKKLVAKMAVPTVISMLVTAFYNMMDTVFVGHLDNTESSAAVGIAFSFMALIQATGFFFGHGSGNFMSRQLGRKDYERAEKMATTGFISPIILGVVIAVLGLFFLDGLALLLGATETNIEYTKDYLKYILAGSPFMMSSLVLNNQLRLQGSAKFAMIGITTGAILNVALDPIFIFTLGMGAGGAALATMISQIISWIVLLAGCGKKGNIAIKLKNFTPNLFYFKEITRGGLPSLCRQGLASVALVFLNHAVGGYGDSAIAAFSIVSKITMITASALIGFGQGFQPVCGFNYGAHLYGRVTEAFWFCVKVALVILVISAALLFAFAPQIIAVFRSEDPVLIEIGAKTLRMQAITFPVHSFIVISNMLLQNIGKTLPASLIAVSRQGMFLIPALVLLTFFFGLSGAQLAQAVADVLSFILAIPLTLKVLKELS